MSGYASGAANVPWWKEPTKDQWYAYFAAWMGWTLDAFDFTVFLLIMSPIAQEFGVPIIEVTAVFSVTLVMRLGGATASGWLGRPFGTPGTADDFDPLDQDHLPGIGIAANEIDEYPADVGEGPAFQRPSIDPVKR